MKIAKTVLLLLILSAGFISAQNLVITEINYNGPESGTDTTEFIEIYNNTDSPIDLSGYKFTSGVVFTFYGGTTLAAGELMVIAYDSTLVQWQGVSYQILEWTSGGLSNGGEPVAIKDADNNLLDSLRYDDVSPWPTEPDGDGPTLELMDANSDNAVATSWVASEGTGGTPGTLYVVTEDTKVKFASTSATVGEADGTYDLTFSISNESATAATTFDVVLKSGDVADIDNYSTQQVTFPAGDVTDQTVTVTITDDAEIEIQESFTFAIRSVAGGLNAVAGADSLFVLSIDDNDTPVPPLVITEINYNQPGSDLREMIELYNNGSETVDLEGYNFTQGFVYTFEAGASIEAGEFIIVTMDSTMYNQLGVKVFEWTSGGLSNSGEDVILVTPENIVVDIVDYDDGGEWPSVADGSGPSLVIIDVDANNNDAANWKASNFMDGTPGYKEEPIENTAFYTIDVRARTNNGLKKYLKLGLDPTATDGIDAALMEAELPPMPPTGIFEIRYELPNSTVGSYYDYRLGNAETNDSLVHKLMWQLGTGDSLYLDITYQDIASPLYISVQDLFGGAVVDLGGSFQYQSFVISNSGITAVNVGVKYEAPVPVELTSFAANVGDNGVELNWSTATELNNKGFEVLRSTDNENFSKIAFVDGYGTTAEVQNYTFVDPSATAGNYFYQLKQIDFDGTFAYSDVVEVELAVTKFDLAQNYPNPFNPATTISFAIPENANVKLEVYNLIGQKVATVVNEVKEAGVYNVNFDASELTSGIYFYTISAGNYTATRKMMLLK